MLGENIPEFNIGFIANVTKEDNLKRFADMMKLLNYSLVPTLSYILITVTLLVHYILLVGRRDSLA